MVKIAGVIYPPKKKIYEDDKKIKYAFEIENEVLELEIEGFSTNRFLYADEEYIITRKGNFTFVVTDHDLNVIQEKTIDGYKIQQVYRLKNGNYLVGTLDEKQTSYIFLINPQMEILAKNQLGTVCWHSQKAIDENDECLMFAEYQNFAKEVGLPEEVSVFRSKDFGYTWEKVFSQKHPKEVRHWHTLQKDPYFENHWIVTSGDTSSQSRWFLSKDNGDSWSEITDKSFALEEFPQKSQSIHRSTIFENLEDGTLCATDDILGEPLSYFINFKGRRKTSSKLFFASKSEPIVVKRLGNIGIQARCLIDIGKGYIVTTEAKYIAYNQQVFYISKKDLTKIFFLFDIDATRRHSGCGSICSVKYDNYFFTYSANKTFLDSPFQTLKWKVDYIQKSDNFIYNIQDYVKFEEHLWFINKINHIQNIVFYNGAVKVELKETKEENTFYMLLGDAVTNRLDSKKLFEMRDEYYEIELEADFSLVKCSLFIQQYDESEKVSSKSYVLKNGNNKIEFQKNKNAKYLKLLIRIAHREAEEIMFSSLSIKTIDKISKIDIPKSIRKESIQKTSIPSSRFMQKDDINELIFDKYVQYNFKQNEFDYDMVTHFKKDSDKLVIFYNGAVDVVKTPPPVFQRWSWLEKMPYSSMVIMDPTIYKLMQKNQDNTYIGWYQGDKERFVLENIVDIVKDFAQKLDVSNDDILFYGSSAGGFASLMSAAMIPNSKACVVNPQVDILEYHKKNVTILLKHLEQNLGKAKKDTRLNVVKFYQQKDIYPQIYFKQNTKDELHFEKHFKLIEGLYNDKQNDIHIELMDDPRGHSAIPLFDEAYSDIEKTFEIFKKKVVPVSCYGIYKNKSSYNLFKPREDVNEFELTYPLDWNIDPFNDRNWCFQLHSWRMLDTDITNVFKNYDEETFTNIMLVIKDWYEYSIVNKNITEYTWYDMATGLRAMKIALIKEKYYNYLSNDMKKVLDKLAYLHLQELEAQKLSLNNHGIFQAHGLLMLSLVYNEYRLKKIGIERMEILVSQQFYEDGWHVENSDKYHWFVLDLFKRFLILSEYAQSDKIQSIIKNAENVKNWTVFPDNQSLMIGDSEYKIRNLNTKKEYFQQDIKLFDNSGYVYITNRDDSDNESMLFFQTAFKNTVHRQADDFNILLYEYGKNILVDVGQYAYSKDKKRGYALSTRAHNTVLIDGKNYKIDSKYYYESALELQEEKNGVFILKTSLQRKDIDVEHHRIILYKPTEFLVVVDSLSSQTKREYKQIWHFHEDLEITQEEKGFKTFIKDDIVMNIKPMVLSKGRFVTNQNVALIKGQTEPELQGWRSLKYKEMIPNYALENVISSKKSILMTQFTFNDVTVDIQVIEDKVQLPAYDIEAIM